MDAEADSVDTGRTASKASSLPDVDGLAGWFRAGSAPHHYRFGVDRNVAHRGSGSGFIWSEGPAGDGFGTLMQMFKADDYRSQRFRLSGYVRSEDVEDWAGMWMRVDGPDGNEPLAFDNMSGRRIRGTTEWTLHQIILDVPAVATHIAFGILLSGHGRVWLDDLTFEAVDQTVEPTTGQNLDYPDGPRNLDFEEHGAVPGPR